MRHSKLIFILGLLLNPITLYILLYFLSGDFWERIILGWLLGIGVGVFLILVFIWRKFRPGFIEDYHSIIIFGSLATSLTLLAVEYPTGCFEFNIFSNGRDPLRCIIFFLIPQLISTAVLVISTAFWLAKRVTKYSFLFISLIWCIELEILLFGLAFFYFA